MTSEYPIAKLVSRHTMPCDCEWNICMAITCLILIASIAYVLGYNAGYGAYP